MRMKGFISQSEKGWGTPSEAGGSPGPKGWFAIFYSGEKGLAVPLSCDGGWVFN